MVARGVSRLLVASGKSVSTESVGVVRGMVTCMICGHEAGATAAVAADLKTTRAAAEERRKWGVHPHAFCAEILALAGGHP